MVHYRAWVKPMEGQTIEQARDYLKDDFFTHRIPYYAPSFGCKTPAENATALLKALLADLYKALEAKDVESALKVFSTDAKVSDPKTGKFTRSPKEYLTQLLHNTDGRPESSVRVVNPVSPQIIGAASVATAVEDYVFSNVKAPSALYTHIVVYHLKEDKINKVEVFEKEVLNSRQDKNLKNYYAAVNTNKKSEVKKFYASEHVISDPVGIPPRTFDSVYDKAFSAKKFQITPTRFYYAHDAIATLIFGEFDYEGRQFTSTPIQIFHFDSQSKLVSFDAYFVPTFIKFN